MSAQGTTPWNPPGQGLRPRHPRLFAFGFTSLSGVDRRWRLPQRAPRASCLFAFGFASLVGFAAVGGSPWRLGLRPRRLVWPPSASRHARGSSALAGSSAPGASSLASGLVAFGSLRWFLRVGSLGVAVPGRLGLGAGWVGRRLESRGWGDDGPLIDEGGVRVRGSTGRAGHPGCRRGARRSHPVRLVTGPSGGRGRSPGGRARALTRRGLGRVRGWECWYGQGRGSPGRRRRGAGRAGA